MSGAFTVWLTGPPAAGKTTLAALLAEALEAAGLEVQVLDSGRLRRDFFPGMGFSREERTLVTLRLARLAQMLNKHDVCCVVCQIAPYAADRLEARRMINEFIEVHLDCPLEQLVNRDQSGIYARALAGEAKGVSGVDDPYEAPEDPEVVCRTDRQTPRQSTAAVLNYLLEAGLLEGGVDPNQDDSPAYTPEQEAIIRKRLPTWVIFNQIIKTTS